MDNPDFQKVFREEAVFGNGAEKQEYRQFNLSEGGLKACYGAGETGTIFAKSCPELDESSRSALGLPSFDLTGARQKVVGELEKLCNQNRHSKGNLADRIPFMVVESPPERRVEGFEFSQEQLHEISTTAAGVILQNSNFGSGRPRENLEFAFRWATDRGEAAVIQLTAAINEELAKKGHSEIKLTSDYKAESEDHCIAGINHPSKVLTANFKVKNDSAAAKADNMEIRVYPIGPFR